MNNLYLLYLLFSFFILPDCCLKQVGNVLGHHLHGHCQQNDAEEFAGEHHTALAQEFLDFSGALDDKEHPYHVDGQPDEDVHIVIHGLERDERRQHTGARNQWEHHRHHRRSLVGSVVLEDFHVKDHLQRHQEHQETASRGKRVDIAVEDPQQPVPTVVEAYHQQGGVEGGLGGIHVSPLIPQLQDDGYGAHNVDNTQQHQRCTQDLREID